MLKTHSVVLTLIVVFTLISFVVVFVSWWNWPQNHANWFNQVHAEPNAETVAQHGQFGDIFGSLNALWTALAFVGVVGTLLIQLWSQVEQSQQFSSGQKSSAQTAELTAKTAQLTAVSLFLTRVDNLLARTEGSKSEAELRQRQKWMADRKTYIETIRKIGMELKLKLPAEADE